MELAMIRFLAPMFKKCLMQIRLFIVLLTLLGFNLLLVPDANAMIDQREESPGHLLDQSRETLQDQQGHRWQVILFKQTQDHQAATINLRLVGFPEITTFIHPAPLLIRSFTQSDRLAQDVFAEKAPATNVGQYDFQDIIQQMEASSFWELEIPVVSESKIILKIPYFLIREWQKLVAAPIT
jgi:hypothetical protein